MDNYDKEILEAIASGADKPILEKIYSDYFPGIKHYVCRNRGDEDEAFDVFQEAVIVLFKQVRLKKFDSKFKIQSFLFAVSKNLWINRVKRMARNTRWIQEPEIPEETPSILHGMIDSERDNLIHSLMDQLGDNCKKILTLSIFEGESMKEIADKMNYSSENAAKTRNYKCKQKLIKLVKDNDSIIELLKK